ncbi:MAG: ATP-binding protein, partial [Spirochaetes bacterium]|nr:ATP-binding protein [Spirochaetota bacterium]
MKNTNNNSSSNMVLIIEDDTAQLKTLADIIQSEGFNPLCCHTDREAFKILKLNKINVVILDLKLGDVDGVAVFRKIRSEYPDVKVIIHTAYASIESAVAAVNEEAFAYVTKMDSVEDLISYVHGAFREHFADYTELLQKEVENRTAELRKANEDLKKEITDRKRAEEALRASEALYTALFQHNPIQTIFVDCQGKVVGFNRAKQSSGDRLPRIGDLMYRDYASQHKIDMYEQLINCIKTGKMGEFPEMEYFDKVLSIKISPFEQGAIITSQDITERTRLLQQLIHSEKLASVGQLAAGVAHEFNNLLTVIIGRAQIAMEENSIDEIRESLNVIENTSKRGSALVKNLSAFARPKEPRFKLQDITELIDEVLKFQKRQLQLENIEIEKEYDTSVKASFDWGQMEQVFLNLLINSIHAIKPKGKGAIKISVKSSDNRIKVSFADTGIGMDEKTRLKIFDPFFSTKGAWANDGLGIPGTGLGLSVSHAIIKKHNGTIHVKSTKGRGTTFIITLPAAVSGRAHKEPQRAK